MLDLLLLSLLPLFAMLLWAMKRLAAFSVVSRRSMEQMTRAEEHMTRAEEHMTRAEGHMTRAEEHMIRAEGHMTGAEGHTVRMVALLQSIDETLAGRNPSGG